MWIAQKSFSGFHLEKKIISILWFLKNNNNNNNIIIGRKNKLVFLAVLFGG